MEVQNVKDSDSEEQNKMVSLTEKIGQLKSENKKIRDEFNVQRAKMKDLFLQKEEEFNKEKSRLTLESDKLQDELNEIRSQLLIAGMKLENEVEDQKRKAQEEIATLQHLVHETVEESSSSRNIFDSEVRKLQSTIQQLQEENRDLKTIGQQSSPHHSAQKAPLWRTLHEHLKVPVQWRLRTAFMVKQIYHFLKSAFEQNATVKGVMESGSLAPSVMLSHVTKTLARKLGADSFSTQENLEESMRKAQEDAEMLRSLVVPLEEEIKCLKDKLRSTDDQLQRCKLCAHQPSPSVDHNSFPTENISQNVPTFNLEGENVPNETLPSPKSPPGCDMCLNYETQLVLEQKQNSELKNRLITAEKAIERHKEELMKEIGFRKDMEEKWTQKKEEHKVQVVELNKRTLCAEQDLNELRKTFSEYSSALTEQLGHLTREREHVHQRLVILQRENDHLVGKYTTHSQQLQNEAINLPDSVEELQEKLLKLQEDRIIAVVGKEAAQEQEKILQSEIVMLRTQNSETEKLYQDLINDLDAQRMDNERLDKEKRHLAVVQEKYRQNEKVLRDQVTQINVQLGETQKLVKQLEESNSELRLRVASLQNELDNSEHVQKDFVLLSQSLQVQLEKIRASDTQVRWQFDDDVDECPGCRAPFAGQSSARRAKHHCLHCGQVFCQSCLNRTVPSGPKMRPAKVCDVCHTLLVKSSAPYFSTDPPHSPD